MDADYLPSRPPAPTGPRRSIAGVAAGVVALFAASVFGLVSVRADAGAGSPEGAVRALLDAAAAEDVLGVLDALVPAERDALRPGVVDLVEELERLEVLSGDASLSDFAGIDLAFDDVDLESESLGEGRAAVRLEGGTASTRVDPKALPLGDFVRDLVGAALDEAPVEEDSGPIGDDTVLVAVRDGDRWYVSIWYTVAEAARAGAGRPPGPDDGIEAAGAASPEDAVRDLLQAAAHLDLRRVLELLPPDEAAALHDYAGLFLPDAEGAAAFARRFLELRIDPLELSSKGTDGGTLVQVRSIGVHGSAGGAIFDYRDGCATFTVEGQEQRVCAGDEAAADVPAALRPLLSLGDRRPDLGFVTVERDGDWYVSPTRTLLGGLVATARALDREDLDAIAGAFGALLGSELVPEPAPRR